MSFSGVIRHLTIFTAGAFI